MSRFISKENQTMWNNPDNFNKISVDTYKAMLSEAQERYKDVMDESNKTTEKAIKVILALTAIATWAATSIVSLKSIYWLSILFAATFLYGIWNLISLLLPKKVILLGTSPSVLLKDEEDLTDDKYSLEERDQIFFYHQLNRYEKRIKKMSNQNADRFRKYKIGLYISYILLIGSIVLFVYVKYKNL